jgi:hypothetical protein
VWATSIFFIKLLKVNSHPMGENSPNLVTLVPISIVGRLLQGKEKGYKRAGI